MSVLSDFPQVGDLFLGRYRIESVIGSGGFAKVYRATQTDLDRDVAIKVMRPAIEKEDSTEETIAQIELVEQRFRREAKVISKFRSPNTVVVHDYGRTEGGLLYMTLEYVDGETLSRIIRRDAPLDPSRAVHLVRQVLDSLHEAHAFDVLHRDIKPQNLMVFNHLDQHDLIKVLDFGIAKVLEVEEEAAAVQELTTDGTLIGTPRYMSPEQIRGDRLSAASDLYSLGLVLYEALTGVKAVSEKTTMRIIAVHLDPRPFDFPPDKEMGAGMRAILERMLAKEPGDRFQTAKEVLAAFDAWDSDEVLVLPEAPPVVEPKQEPPRLPPVPRPPRERTRTPTIGATLAPQQDSEAERAPTLVVDPEEIGTEPDIDVLPETDPNTPSVAQTQPLTAEEIEEASREDRSSAPVDVAAAPQSDAGLPVSTLDALETETDVSELEAETLPFGPAVDDPLYAEVDEDDTQDRPAAFLPTRLLPILTTAGVVLFLGIVGFVVFSGDDGAEAAASSDLDKNGMPAVTKDGQAATEHAELRDTQPEPAPLEDRADDEGSTDEVPTELHEAEPAADVTPDLGDEDPTVADDGEKDKRDEPEGVDEAAEVAEPKPPPRRNPPPKKRNKLWSLE